jgi:uncharacterized protein YkwD
MLLLPRQQNLRDILVHKAVRLNLLIAASLLSGASAFAQNAELQPILLEARAGESTFTRPRRIKPEMLEVSESAATNPFSIEQASALERSAFKRINEARSDHGLPPLAWDAELCRLARAHSEDMGRRGYFDHETPEGLRPKERARASGYRFRVIAENIAYNKGYQDPAGLAVSRWMKSSGHRENILYQAFQYSAVGSYVSSDGTVFLTQVFVSR